jgi:hypothetical protein
VQTAVTLPKRLATVNPVHSRFPVIEARAQSTRKRLYASTPWHAGTVSYPERRCYSRPHRRDHGGGVDDRNVDDDASDLYQNFKALSTKLNEIICVRAQSVRFEEAERDRRSPTPQVYYCELQNRNQQTPIRTKSFP